VASIDTQIEIAADSASVWQLLSDLSGYPGWNPSIIRLEGRCGSGEKLRLRARMPGGLKINLRPVLDRVEQGRTLAWSASLLAPGFFSAEHRFSIEELRAGGIRLVQREDFRGWFAPVFLYFFASGLQRSYEEANARLKSLVETIPAATRA
jgi:hypothetical protein